MPGWLLRMQRYSAVALIPFVLTHLATLLLIGSAGLSANDVLSRTRGSLVWMIFYSLFVGLLALHSAIGIWQVGRLINRVSPWLVAAVAWLFALATLGLGARAVLGLYTAAAA